MNRRQDRSYSGSPSLSNCADCGAPLEDEEEEEEDEEEEEEEENDGLGPEELDLRTQRPIWISKNSHADNNGMRRDSNEDPDNSASSRSKSLDRTTSHCVPRTTASPSPRRVVRHKTPPPFQLNRTPAAAGPTATAAASSPAAPRWDGISVWIPNTDLATAAAVTPRPRRARVPPPSRAAVDDCAGSSGAASSLRTTSSVRSRGGRSAGTSELSSPSIVSSRPGSAEEGGRRLGCAAQGHLQAAAVGTRNRRTGFSIFGSDAPELQPNRGTSGRAVTSAEASASRNDVTGTRELARRKPPNCKTEFAAGENLEQRSIGRGGGGGAVSSPRFQSSTAVAGNTGSTDRHRDSFFAACDHLRRFSSSEVSVATGRGAPIAPESPAPSILRTSRNNNNSNSSNNSGLFGSLPRRITGSTDAAFSPEDVLNWKMSLMDSSGAGLSPSSDDEEEDDCLSSGACSPSTRAPESTAVSTGSNAFSFEDTLEEVLESRLKQRSDEDDDYDCDEGEGVATEGQVGGHAGNPDSYFDMFENHLDHLLSQPLDASDPYKSLVKNLEIYRSQMRKRKGLAARCTRQNSTLDTRKQFLSLTDGVQCLSDLKSPPDNRSLPETELLPQQQTARAEDGRRYDSKRGNRDVIDGIVVCEDNRPIESFEALKNSHLLLSTEGSNCEQNRIVRRKPKSGKNGCEGSVPSPNEDPPPTITNHSCIMRSTTHNAAKPTREFPDPKNCDHQRRSLDVYTTASVAPGARLGDSAPRGPPWHDPLGPLPVPRPSKIPTVLMTVVDPKGPDDRLRSGGRWTSSPESAHLERDGYLSWSVTDQRPSSPDPPRPNAAGSDRPWSAPVNSSGGRSTTSRPPPPLQRPGGQAAVVDANCLSSSSRRGTPASPSFVGGLRQGGCGVDRVFGDAIDVGRGGNDSVRAAHDRDGAGSEEEEEGVGRSKSTVVDRRIDLPTYESGEEVTCYRPNAANTTALEEYGEEEEEGEGDEGRGYEWGRAGDRIMGPQRSGSHPVRDPLNGAANFAAGAEVSRGSDRRNTKMSREMMAVSRRANESFREVESSSAAAAADGYRRPLYSYASRRQQPQKNGVVDLRVSIKNALDRMTEQTLLCLQDSEEAARDRKDFPSPSSSSSSPSSSSTSVLPPGPRGAKTGRSDSLGARLAKVRQFQEDFLDELLLLDARRAAKLIHCQKRLETLEKFFSVVFGEEAGRREGTVVKKFVISAAAASADRAEDWENPRQQHPNEVDVIVLRDGITIEGLHVDGTYDNKPIRVQQHEIQRLYDSTVRHFAARNSFAEMSYSFENEGDRRSKKQENNTQSQWTMSSEMDLLPPPPPEWNT